MKIIWFVSRDKLDEFVSARKLSMDEADATNAADGKSTELPNDDESKIAHAPHVIELYEVRTINAGLKELSAFGFTIEDLIPKDRTGRTDSRYKLLREEAELGLEDLRGLLPAIRAAGEKGLQITRFKGLGEMNAEELWETTMNPEHRILKQVTIDDGQMADKIFDILMGTDVPSRKAFIQSNAKMATLDI